MLFIQSKSLALGLTEAERLGLLDVLRAQEFTPLIRSARRRCFELLVAEHDDAAFVAAMAAELERQCRTAHAARAGGAYTPGELFCLGDCILFLVFSADEAARVSAGVVYRVETIEPLGQLERFCRAVSAAVEAIRQDTASATEDAPNDLPRWQASARTAQQGLARFMAIQPTDFAVAAKCRSSARELTRASELLAERAVRVFLRRVQEMRREGYTPRRLFAEADRLGGVSVKQMLDAGLLEREVRVSCRKSGHALFDLPTPDALAAITVSKAKCSQCAAPVVDEVVEETINPTWLAVSLLEDGNWLSNRVYKIISALGVPPSELATGPVSAHGESYLAAEVCGSSFLFVTKDGDLTPACSRRIAEQVAETGATHLVVVITGVVEDEGRLRLYEFTWRRARDGQDLDTTFIEGVAEARAALARAFQRAVRHELTHQLYTLDAALGASASNFVLNWFKLLTPAPNATDQPAARLFEAALEHIS
jgi:hypothetical protein